jgi:hypothetical protein
MPIHFEKEHADHEAGALVAIDKRMVADKPAVYAAAISMRSGFSR